MLLATNENKGLPNNISKSVKHPYCGKALILWDLFNQLGIYINIFIPETKKIILSRAKNKHKATVRFVFILITFTADGGLVLGCLTEITDLVDG